MSLHMPTPEQFSEMDREVRAFLSTHLEESPCYRAFVIELWGHHLALKLPKQHFVAEFTSGKRERFFQRLWEMLLARHFSAQGHALTSPDIGPDFRFEYEGKGDLG
jgi:hypothetical protein